MTIEEQLSAHRRILYKVANAYCRDPEDRRDLVQEMLVQVWRSYPRYDERTARFSTWMYRVALNVAISFQRSERRRIRPRDTVPLDDVSLAAADQVVADAGDDLRTLHRLIAALEPLNRALILLYLDDVPQDEIAQIMGISTGNVATRINRIKKNWEGKSDMTIDDLKSAWAASDAKLDAALRLNAALLRRAGLDRASTTLRRLLPGILIELALNLIVLVWLGGFASDHADHLGLLLPALALGAGSLALVIAGARQLAMIAQIDHSGPVIAIQKQLGALRVLRVRVTRWVWLLAPLAWTPLLVVTLATLLPVDPYDLLGTAWLIANLAFGVAAIPLMLWISRRVSTRWPPFARRLADDIAGRSLVTAAAFVDDVARFETDGVILGG